MSQDTYDLVVAYVLKNQTKFYRLAYSYTKHKDAALDVMQNAICKALEKHHTLKNNNAVKTWFYRVLVNECLAFLKKKSKECSWEPQTMEVAYQEPAYEHGLMLYQMVEALPQEIRTIIVLHYYEDMTLREIAAITRVNVNTVKSRLYKGLRKLKTLYKEG